jgi:hypothetical protein
MAKVTRHGGATNVTPETPELEAEAEAGSDNVGDTDTDTPSIADTALAPVAETEVVDESPVATTTISNTTTQRRRRSGF